MGNLVTPHKNYFLTEGLSITDIPIEKKEILNKMISKIEILNYTYICRCCKKIPKIDITYYQDGKIEKLICKNCDYSTELNNKYDFYDDSFCEKIPI